MTRLFRLTAAAVLVAGICPAVSRAAEPDKLIPATADSVVIVNVRQILDSDIAKKYALEQIKQALDGQDLKKMLGDLGLNPLKDINQLVIAASGANKDDVKLMVILHGKFNPSKLNAAAEVQSKQDPDKFSLIRDGGTITFKIVPDNGPFPAMYASVIDEETVVAATEQKLITQARSAAANNLSTLNKDMAALIRRQDDKASVVVAGLFKNKLESAKIPGGGNLPIDLSAFQELLPKMDNMAVTMNVKTDITFEVTLGMKDDDSAGDFRKAFEDLLKQLKPLAGIAGAAEPRAKPLGDILNTFKSSAKGREVVITGKISGANIGKMVNPDE